MDILVCTLGVHNRVPLYIEQNDLEIIVNLPDNLLLAEREIHKKEIEDIRKPLLQPKELFQLRHTLVCKW